MNKRSTYLLIIPGILGILLFALFPLIQIIIPTLNSSSLFKNYISFLKIAYNQQVIFRTLIIALITTAITLFLGLPLAIWIARQKNNFRKILSVIILFPILTNAVIRNFAWIIILGKNGVFNTLLLKLHLISSPKAILYTDSAIIIGSIYLFLPIMVISLTGSVEKLNLEVEEAAAVLGARPVVSLFKVIIPQLKTGIWTGCILVFAGSMTAYTTPQILGGNRDLVMSTLIYQKSMTLGDWSSAGVVAVVLILLSLIVLGLMNLISRRLDRRSVHA